MSEPSANQDRTAPPDPLRISNPADAYAPSRPSKLVIAAALAAAVIVLGFENWSDVPSAVHVSQIEKALGL
jgi:hypothetical protein